MHTITAPETLAGATCDVKHELMDLSPLESALLTAAHDLNTGTWAPTLADQELAVSIHAALWDSVRCPSPWDADLLGSSTDPVPIPDRIAYLNDAVTHLNALVNADAHCSCTPSRLAALIAATAADCHQVSLRGQLLLDEAADAEARADTLDLVNEAVHLLTLLDQHVAVALTEPVAETGL